MTSSQEDTASMLRDRAAGPPYLTLTVPEAHALSDPPDPEPRRFETLVHLLDHRAQYDADKVAVGFPDSPGRAHDDKERATEECLRWSYSDLSALSQATAFHLRKSLKTGLNSPRASKSPKHEQPIVAIFAPSGPAFLLHALACWRLGAAILPIALGTTADGAAHLIKQARCSNLLAHQSQHAVSSAMLEKLDAMCEGQRVTKIPWHEECFQTSRDSSHVTPLYTMSGDDVLVIFHSSGSTGNPKPIPQLDRFWTSSLLSASGRTSAAYTTTPLYHGGLSDLFRALQAAAPIYFFAWHQPKAPTTSNIVASVRTCAPDKIRYFLSVPFILEMLAKESSGRTMLQEMDLVSTGGAPLAQEAGDDLVSQHNIKLVSRLGSSECGFLMSSWRNFVIEKDWSSLRLPDEADHTWLEFVLQNDDPGLFELVVKPRWPTKLLSNRDDGSYATGDLYEPAKAGSNCWRYARRSDDAIVMVNGKKIASAAIEAKMRSCSLVEDVIVFGANRPILGAVILPATESETLAASPEDSERLFLRQLNSTLKGVNAQLPSHARIPLEMVEVVDSETFSNLPRSSKGTLQRGLALEKLKTVIDDLYLRFEKGEAPLLQPRAHLVGAPLRNWLREAIIEISGVELADDADFYENGIDSIMAARIRSALLQHVDLGRLQLAANAVYEHPNISLLSQLIEERGISRGSNNEPRQTAQMLVERYSLRETSVRTAVSFKKRVTVLLTGATGALGTRVLKLLCDTASVKKIVCPVRAATPSSARTRLCEALHSKRCGIADALFTEKVQCVSTLDDEVRQLVQNADNLVVIYCAWIVNFALQLGSFEKDCIAPLHDTLFTFVGAKHPSRFIYCSSLASILAGPGPYAEEPSSDVKDAGMTGYGQSKWVAERICESLGPKAKVTIARVGQLCGDTKYGIWNESEAWPLLVRTAIEVGCLPENGPDIDWLPVNTAASSIVELALAQASERLVVHVALPDIAHRMTWPQFLKALKAGGLAFKPVPKAEWLAAVRSAGTQVRGRALIDVWEKLPKCGEQLVVETVHAESASTALRSSGGVNASLCLRFIEAWRASGFLASS